MPVWTSVEKSFLALAGDDAASSYNSEHVPVVKVQNVYELGKIVALSFLEWITANPDGVISLPTGKTPEYFIKTLEIYKSSWSDPKVRSEMQQAGFEPGASFPRTDGLRFVMLDEFFPMDCNHRNSFVNYIRKYYTGPLGIKEENIYDFDLVGRGIITQEEMAEFQHDGIVDLTLLGREPSNEKETVKKAMLGKVNEYCQQYERTVRELGGIGFFLGGIGPDGHIAFNQEGCSHASETRLVNFNYPSAAAAAGDLGGIEKAKTIAAMTIGLATIAFNNNSKVIIMAAGEGKANVIRAALEEPAAPSRPASVLHSLPNSRFYITHGAGKQLTERKTKVIASASSSALEWATAHLAKSRGETQTEGKGICYVNPPEEYSVLEQFLYSVSLTSKKSVHTLQLADATANPIHRLPAWLDEEAFKLMCECATQRLNEKIGGGLTAAYPTGSTVLHTAPHHDDIMLSYHGAMHGMLGRDQDPMKEDDSNSNDNGNGNSNGNSNGHNNGSIDSKLGEQFNGNTNHFCYLTSGFHSVNDGFLLAKVTAALAPVAVQEQGLGEGEVKNYHSLIACAVKQGRVSMPYDDLMTEFRTAFFVKDFPAQEALERLLFIRKVAEVWDIDVNIESSRSESDPAAQSDLLIEQITAKVEWIKDSYLAHHRPGDAVPKEMQLVKGCMRESEADRVWACSKAPMVRVHHMRSSFYNDDFFTPLPSLAKDVAPMADLIKRTQPDLLTVAFDPEGTGPDTHYKVLLLVAAGLNMSIERGDLGSKGNGADMMVWGYRNVWFIFEPSHATLMVPVGGGDLDLMHDTFMSCFTTQKDASFPSPAYEGTFSAWARQLQKEQKDILETLLGKEYFAGHPDPRVRNSGGFVFLRGMPVKQFLHEVDQLKSKFQNVE